MKSQALCSLQTVQDRLRAWRDNAKLMLQSCSVSDENRWQNEYDNYQYLVTCLGVVERLIKSDATVR